MTFSAKLAHRLRALGAAVYYSRALEGAQMLENVAVRLSVVDYRGQTERLRQLKLGGEIKQLLILRRKIVVIIKPDFAERSHVGITYRPLKYLQAVR